MIQQKKFLFAAILSGIVLMVGALALWHIYRAVWRYESAQLQGMADTHAGFIEALIEFEQAGSNGLLSPQARARIIAQVDNAYQHMSGAHVGHRLLGGPNIVVFARDGQTIEIVARHCHRGHDEHPRIAYDSPQAELMRRALAGEQGIAETDDCLGESRMLAAYRPIGGMDLGLIAYLEIASLRQPFLYSAALIVLSGALLIVLGSWLFFRLTMPMLRELQRNEHKYRRLVENMDGIVYQFSTRKGALYWSPRIFDTLGFRPDELYARPYLWHDAIHPEDLPAVDQAIADFELGRRIDLEYRVHDRQGHWHWFSDRSISHLDEGGDIIIEGVANNIDIRKQAEEDRRASESRYRSLFEKMLDGFALHEILTDAQGTPCDYRFLDVNPAFTRQTGLSAEAVLGRRVREIMPGIEDWWIETYGKVALSGEAVRFEQYTGALGKYFEVVAFAPVCGQFATIFQDIGARKENEKLAQQARADLEQTVAARTRELQLANTQLQRLAKLKDEFLASVSHELRSPLNSVLTNAEVLQEGLYGELLPKQQRAIGQMADSGRHLLTLINDILDLAKVEAGKVKLDIQPTSPLGICQSCLNLIKEQALKKRLHIRTSFDPSVTVMQVDPRRLKQILINLLSNAVKFTPEGGQIGLEFSADAHKQKVSFHVWDTGIGIPAAMLDKLFQPFVQLDSSLSRNYTGTGLGLALVKDLADLHGGGVSLDSEEGQGSRFTVTLPWSDTETQADQAESGPAGGNNDARGGRRILLVDDNLHNLEGLGDYLSFKGHTVLTATDGATGIQQARAHKPEIILMDIQMPGMDGLEAIGRIRADAALADVPIIALTALVMPGDRDRCLQAGANAYLGKPVVLRELLAMIAQLSPAPPGHEGTTT